MSRSRPNATTALSAPIGSAKATMTSVRGWRLKSPRRRTPEGSVLEATSAASPGSVASGISRYDIQIRSTVTPRGRQRRPRRPEPSPETLPEPTDEEYQRLLDLRTGLRRFLHWSEVQAQAEGITPTQHQLLLAIRGHPDPAGPSIGEIAGYLVVRHHSAVGLVDRAAAAGLVTREPDAERAGTVRVVLTEHGRQTLDSLAKLHLAELARLAPTMETLWRTLGRLGEEADSPAPPELRRADGRPD